MRQTLCLERTKFLADDTSAIFQYSDQMSNTLWMLQEKEEEEQKDEENDDCDGDEDDDEDNEDENDEEIGRAHVWTPVTPISRMPSSAWKKKKKIII